MKDDPDTARARRDEIKKQKDDGMYEPPPMVRH